MALQFLQRQQHRPGVLIRAAQTAIEQKVQQGHEPMGLQQSRLFARTLTWALIGCTGFGLVWLSVGQTEEVVMATGKLDPSVMSARSRCPWGGCWIRCW